MTRTRNMARALTPLIAAVSLIWAVAPASAAEETLEVTASSITSEFPFGFRIKVEAKGENEITSVAVRLRIGQRKTGAFDYLCPAGSLAARTGLPCDGLEPARVVDGELFWRTNTSARFIPPGTIIHYNFEIEDSEGARLETEQQDFTYHDPRFEWVEVSDGPVTVIYHSVLVKKRAEIVLNAITTTLATMGPILGAGAEEPIRVTMYNNVKEMLEALPPKSQAISRELMTEGQAFSDVGTLLVLGGGRLAKGTASHEVTHILVHRAGDSIFRRIPPWLNEGLAEYGNIDPGYSYDIALDFAVNTGRLLPIMHMRAMPGDPEQVIIFYGQGRSIVRFMIREFGADKMKHLMAALKSGTNMDDALLEVYGHRLLELDNLWRESVGAPAYVLPERGRARPTPIPQRVILPYSLTPQPGGEAIGARSADPTVTPTPTAAPTLEPAPTAAPIPSATAAPTAPPAPTLQPDELEEPGASGASCLAPTNGEAGAFDLAGAGLVLGLVGLALRKRRKGEWGDEE